MSASLGTGWLAVHDQGQIACDTVCAALNFKATFYYMHVYVRVCGGVAWTQCFVARCITLRSQRCQSDDK